MVDTGVRCSKGLDRKDSNMMKLKDKWRLLNKIYLRIKQLQKQLSN